MAKGLGKSDVPKRIEPINRAWWVLLGAGLCIFCGQPAVILFTFGTFAPEIVRATHWSPVVVAAAIGPGTLLAALLAPAVGYGADRFGVRRMALIGGPAYGVGLAALGALPQTATQFIAFLALACGLGFAATPVLYAHLVTGWFTTRRGLALSVVFGCSSLGVSSWSPIAAALMHFGWRTVYEIIGAATGTIIFASTAILLRNPPQSMRGTQVPVAEGATLAQALRSPTFWRIALVFMLLTGVLGGSSVNLPVILRLNGLTPQEAASVMTVVGIAMFCGMASVGLLLDRWFAPFVTGACALLPALAFLLLLFDHSTSAFFFAAAMIGAGLGSELNAGAFMVSRAFGIRSFGAIYGLVTLAYGVSSAIGPALIGTALARSFNLNLIFGSALTLLLPAIALLFTMRAHHLPYRPPARNDVFAQSGVAN